MAFSLPISAPKQNFTPTLQMLEQALSRIANTVGVVFADKKVQANEWFMLLGEFGDIQTVLSVFPDASRYFLSLSKSDQKAEIALFVETLSLSTEDATVKVRAIFKGGSQIYGGISKAFSGVKLVHTAFSQNWTKK